MQSVTNQDMCNMIESLHSFGLLDHRDIIGYATARNLRHLQDAAREYLEIRDELLCKYGTREIDERGNPTARFTLNINSDDGKSYLEEISKYQDIKHDVDIFRVPIEDTVGILSGREMLALDWMLSGGGEQ